MATFREPEDPLPQPPPVEQSTDPADEPLIDLTHHLDDAGWDGQFRAAGGGDLQCLSCHEHFPASSQHADHVSRLEGASDPSDMLLVVPVVCPICAAAGTWVAGYGPEASAEDADALRALQRDPAEGIDPSEPTPGVR